MQASPIYILICLIHTKDSVRGKIFFHSHSNLCKIMSEATTQDYDTTLRSDDTRKSTSSGTMTT